MKQQKDVKASNIYKLRKQKNTANKKMDKQKL